MRTAIHVASICVLLSACAACRSSEESSTARSQEQTGGRSTSSQSSTSDHSTDLNRCALLTDSEVEEAIGPHHPGSTGLDNEYGIQGCRWIAATAAKIKGAPDGWFDTIEVTVFEKERESWAREQAQGEPIKGFVDDARYNESYGEVWFTGTHGRFCVVKARTASAVTREQTALHLAQLVDKRLP